MSKSDTFENDLLKLIFNATAIANFVDNAAASPHTLLFVALHTADPGDAGTQATSEITNTGYQRYPIARTTGGWTASSAGSTSPVANMDFQAGTGGAGTATHFSVGVGAISAVTCTSASPCVVSLTSHGFTAQMPFTFTGTTAPTGTTFGTIYYVSATALNANDFTFSASIGGAQVNTSSTGTAVSVVAGKSAAATKILYSGTVTPNITCGNGVTPRLTTASTITED